MPSSNWVNSLDDLYDFLAQVIVCAPDNFIEVDFLPPDEQLNLDLAYEELQRGLALLKKDGCDEERLKALQLLLIDSHAALWSDKEASPEFSRIHAQSVNRKTALIYARSSRRRSIRSRTLVLACNKIPSRAHWEVLSRLTANASRWTRQVNVAIPILE
jgi:hypothetical protein